MKTKVAAIYGKQDIRIREFELPAITENELLVSVIRQRVFIYLESGYAGKRA